MSTNYYVDFGAISSGVGTSGDPFDSTQFTNYNHNGEKISDGVSATNGDNFYLKGFNSTLFGNIYTAKTGGFNYISWDDGAPYKLDATYEDGYVIFGILPYLSAIEHIHHNIKLENAVIHKMYFNGAISATESSGTYILNNDIFYNMFDIIHINRWNIYTNGCTFLSALCEFHSSLIENELYFNDSIFINSNFSDIETNYGIIKFDYCLFTNSITEVSAHLSSTYNDGILEFNNCQFNWIPYKLYPSFNNFITSAIDPNLYANTYGIPNTSTVRYEVWETSGYSKGFWNTDRTGPGAFDFYSLDISTYVNNVDLISTVINPTIITEINTIVTVSTINNFLHFSSPQVYGLSNIKVNFAGVSQNKSSYSLVNFVAKVTTTSEYSGKYKIIEYRWYFDYGRDMNTYEVSTSPKITHKYKGYAGKTFKVKCSVIVRLV
jgi:DNA-binding transcriptional ArsR family regulator